MTANNQDTILSRIRIVVIEPTGSGNAGSIARAMANFGLTNLVFVDPRPFDMELAASFACNGAHIISEAKSVMSFDEAVHDASVIIGMTRRARASETTVPVDIMADTVLHIASDASAAIVLGREKSGLTIEEKKKCTMLCHIDAVSGAAGSLNISHAALLAMHEIFRAASRKPAAGSDIEPLMSALRRFRLLHSGSAPDDSLQNIFRSVFARAMLTAREVKKLSDFFGKLSKAK